MPASPEPPSQTFRPHGFITRLCNWPPVLAGGRFLRLRQKADWLLGRLPIWISDRNGIRRRIDSTESLFAAEEILSHPIYKSIDPWLPHIKSFADLGMNRGYFSLYLDFTTRPFRDKPLEGLGVDANPLLLKIARANLKTNHLDFVHIRHGVVGVTEGVDFHLSSVDTLSSLFEIDALGEKSATETIHVDPIPIAETWRELFGPASCDLLKIDIEGAETMFLELEADFVRTVKYIVIEYHGTASTTREAVEAQLKNLEFEIESHVPNLYKSGVLFARARRLTSS